MTTTHRTTLVLPTIVAATALLLAACGDSDSQSATTAAATTTAAANRTSTSVAAPAAATAADDIDGPYCAIVRAWTVHELDSFDDSDPEALHQYMDEYVAFVHDAANAAPPSMQDEWTVDANAIDTVFVPLFEKYGYSIERAMAEATEDEQALLDQPPPDIAAAQDAIHAYEAEVCHTAQPAAADVTFDGPPSAAYCEASGARDAMFDEVAEAGFQPDAVRRLLTSDELTTMTKATEDAAPDVIKDDVVTLDAFDVAQTYPLFQKYDYDLRRVLLEGSAAERDIVQSWDPAVHDSFARVGAYEEQLCGADDES